MYIRTKDSVYENKNPYFIQKNGLYMSWDYPTGIEADFLGDILNQSENLEELCDEFVFICEDFDKPQLVIPMNFEYCKKTFKHTEIYGAIWTDKGLIYVAKMNDKGELELL